MYEHLDMNRQLFGMYKQLLARQIWFEMCAYGCLCCTLGMPGSTNGTCELSIEIKLTIHQQTSVNYVASRLNLVDNNIIF